jgi:putative OPT family oligopeptide transporter
MEKPRSFLREAFGNGYREITGDAIGFGVVLGCIMAAAFTYSGLLIGFVVPGSLIAATLGWGWLRGVRRRGTIVENNVQQTIATSVQIACSGIIFTLPVLYLRNIDFDPVVFAVAAAAGGFLGNAFIIPLRKQMIEIERLRFPTGVAVTVLLKSPGSGVQKSLLLLGGAAFGLIFFFFTQFDKLGWPVFLPEEVDLGKLLGLPAHVPNVWALSVLSLGAGFISGKVGLVVLFGGILANWVISPAVVELGWLDAHEPSRWASVIYKEMNRPLGIGMLIGGALAGVLVAVPSIRAAFASMRRMEKVEGGAEEMPLKFLNISSVLCVVLLFVAARLTAPEIGWHGAALTAVLGTVWMWLAGIIVAQCTGMTDWSPLSGLALIAVTIILFLTSKNVLAAVLIGAAVCVATAECSDMMIDLKTGFQVGSKPMRMAVAQLLVTWIGPIVSIATVALLWEAYGFGPGKQLTAPQAQALDAAISSVVGGDVPYEKYGAGALIGGALSVSGVHGLGVLMGLSMYLPMAYILPYGLGCLLNMLSLRMRGAVWTEEKAVPVMAGLMVGEAILGLVIALLMVFQVIPGKAG